MLLRTIGETGSRFFLRRYAEDRSEEYPLARSLMLLYLCIFVLVVPVLILTPVVGAEYATLCGMGVFPLVLLGLLKAGHAKVSLLAAIFGYEILVTAMIFFAPAFNRYEVYKITALYLSIVFISALLAYRTLYTLIVSAMALVAVWLDYLLRARHMVSPGKPVAIVDYLTCSGLLVLAVLMVLYLIARSERLLRTAREEARRNEQQAFELLKLRNYLKNVIDAMPSSIISVDSDLQVVEWSLQAEARTGIPRDKALGQFVVELIPSIEEAGDSVRRAVQRREPFRMDRVPVYVSGQVRYESLSVSPLSDAQNDGAVIRLDDVTEQVKMQEVIIHSEKMMSIGGMAAGMAHEINNPLGGMIQSATVMRRRLMEDLPANKRAAAEVGVELSLVSAYMANRGIPSMLNVIFESGQRAASIVRSMLLFARKPAGAEEKVPTDLATLMDQTLELAATDYDMKKELDFRDIQIHRDYEPSMPPVPCIPARFQQVVLNILKNGAEAMQDRKLRESGAYTPCFHLSLRQAENSALIEIQDNGPGMPKDVRTRIFEPFFTTKSAEAGTGLGLSVSYFIISENHGGDMWVESAPEQGSRFFISLPLF